MTRRRSTLADAPIRPPEKRRRRQYYTVEEWQRLLKAARTSVVPSAARDEALLLVMYECGLRRSEPGVMRLGYTDRLHEGFVYTFRGKGSESGYVGLTSTTVDALYVWIDRHYPELETRRASDFLFPGGWRAGFRQGLSGRQVYNIISRLASDAGLPVEVVNPHVLKHSRVQHLLDAAAEHETPPEYIIKTLSEVLGHRAAMTTIQHYLEASKTEKAFVKSVTEELVGGKGGKERGKER